MLLQLLLPVPAPARAWPPSVVLTLASLEALPAPLHRDVVVSKWVSAEDAIKASDLDEEV